jgi:16S rRNA G966 N2-methylase RsmD
MDLSTDRAIFRYAGNKRWLLSLLPPLPSHKRICELYLGSGTLLFNSKLKGLGIESSPFVVSIYEWLKKATPEAVFALEELRKDCLRKQTLDVRDLDIEEGARLYLRLNCCGLITGDFSSYKIYDRKLPVENTVACLDRLKNDIEIQYGTASDYKEQDGDLVFLDPPYLDFRPNKHNKIKETSNIVYGYQKSGKKLKRYNPQDTIDIISRVKGPIIFCYGSTALDLFPMYDWRVIKVKKVGNTEKKTVERREYITYINWRAADKKRMVDMFSEEN